MNKLIFRWSDLPMLTAHLPGTGGVIRQELEDFAVEEVPLYLPEGTGSHAYIKIEKRGLTTRDIVLVLLKQGLREQDIGVAGLKDKYAVTEQWLSVPQRHAEALKLLAEAPGLRILETSRHKNKLGIGHLKGNRFTIRVRKPEVGAVEKARAVLDFLQTKGFPNYFGPQRFGRFGRNALDGLRAIRGEEVPGGHRMKGFSISALQSHVVNHLLAKRINEGIFDSLILGDWAKKHDTGGVFKVEKAEENERAKRLEVSATLPLYGKKVRLSEAVAGELEQTVLNELGLRWLDFVSRRGDRRLSRLLLEEATVEPMLDGYQLRFFLPRGAFATSLLREVLKVAVDEPDGLDLEPA